MKRCGAENRIVRRPAGPGRVARGIDATPHGCENDPASPPAYVVAVPVASGEGLVIACLPLDTELVANAGMKLGLDLAITEPGAWRATPRPWCGYPDQRRYMADRPGLL